MLQTSVRIDELTHRLAEDLAKKATSHGNSRLLREESDSVVQRNSQISVASTLRTSDSSLKNSWAAYGPGNSNHLEIFLTDSKDHCKKCMVLCSGVVKCDVCTGVCVCQGLALNNPDNILLGS